MVESRFLAEKRAVAPLVVCSKNWGTSLTWQKLYQYYVCYGSALQHRHRNTNTTLSQSTIAAVQNQDHPNKQLSLVLIPLQCHKVQD